MFKPKQKKCKYLECDNTFTPFKSTDKYCSYRCHSLDNGNKPKAIKKVTKIKSTSKKRAIELQQYRVNRLIFLDTLDSPYCPVALSVLNKQILATEIHHKAGRVGKLLNEQKYWIAVSREGHEWIHNNPKEAYNHGFLINSSTINQNNSIKV